MRRFVVAFVPQLLVIPGEAIQHWVPRVHLRHVLCLLDVDPVLVRVEDHSIRTTATGSGMVAMRGFRVVRVVQFAGDVEQIGVRTSTTKASVGTRRRRSSSYRQRDVTRHWTFGVQHSFAQGFHSVAVGLLQQRYPVDVQQLVVGAQALIARRRASVDHALDEDPQVLRPTSFAFDAYPESGFLGVVHGDVKSEDLAVLPREDHVVVGLFRGLKTKMSQNYLD